MKYIINFSLSTVVVCSFVTFYIYQNVSLIQSSYRIQNKEKQLVVLADQYKNLKYELNKLYSPMNLEQKLVQSNVELIRPTDIKVFHNPVTLYPTYYAQGKSEKGLGLLGSFDFVSEAHADAVQK